MRIGKISCIGLVSLSLLVLVTMGNGQETNTAGTQPASTSDNCIRCHRELSDSDAKIVEEFSADIHYQSNLSCSSCHGGDPSLPDKDQAKGPGTDYVGVPDVKLIPSLCGKCHSSARYMSAYNPTLAIDQEEKFYTSRHGELLQMGLRKVAHCASCHTAHSIRPVNNPASTVYPTKIPYTCSKCHSDKVYMQGFPIPNDQFDRYSKSVHGVALLEKGDTGAPACNDCHGNHGAQPPGVTSVAYVCGHCHTFNADLFNQSAHKAAFDAKGLPECVTCHGYHDIVHPTDERLGTGPESFCIRCHKPGDKGYQMAHQIYTLLSELSTKHEEARSVVKQAEQKGMEVSDSQFVFNDVLQIVIKAQTLTHSLDFPQIKSAVEEGLVLVTKAREIGEDSLEEFHYRRRWFSISLALMLFVLIILYLKIRSLHH